MEDIMVQWQELQFNLVRRIDGQGMQWQGKIEETSEQGGVATKATILFVPDKRSKVLPGNPAEKWRCFETNTIFTSEDGRFCIIAVVLTEQVSIEANFTLEPLQNQLGKKRWQAREEDTEGVIRVFTPEETGLMPTTADTKWKFTASRILHRSKDGKFFLIAVHLKEELVSGRAIRRRAKKHPTLTECTAA